ncbi:MAG: hypothetical protein KGJ80_21360, partial [Chloroflexota bacterium]|nr:hypothetical protein [Chloroflexota bacterium]
SLWSWHRDAQLVQPESATYLCYRSPLCAFGSGGTLVEKSHQPFVLARHLDFFVKIITGANVECLQMGDARQDEMLSVRRFEHHVASTRFFQQIV